MRLFFPLIFFIFLNNLHADCVIDCLKFKDDSEKLKKCYDACQPSQTQTALPNNEKIEKIFTGNSCITDCEKNRQQAKNVAPISCSEMCKIYQMKKESINSNDTNLKVTTTKIAGLDSCNLTENDLKIVCPFGEYLKNVKENNSVKVKPTAQPPQVQPKFNETRQSFFLITILVFIIIFISIAYIRK